MFLSLLPSWAILARQILAPWLGHSINVKKWFTGHFALPFLNEHLLMISCNGIHTSFYQWHLSTAWYCSTVQYCSLLPGFSLYTVQYLILKIQLNYEVPMKPYCYQNVIIQLSVKNNLWFNLLDFNTND